MLAPAPRSHARLGGSSASIFLSCPGAPDRWLRSGGRRASYYAAEGTLAHHLSEDMLRGLSLPPAGSVHEVEGFTITLTDDMLLGIREYVAEIEAVSSLCDWREIEQEFDLGALWTDHGETPPEPMFGIADFVGVKLASAVLAVHDLKFGKGIPVSAKRNPQLLYYGLGAWLWLKANRPDLAAQIRYVDLNIHQPRAIGHTRWTIDLVDLLLWGDFTLKATVDKIAAHDTYLHAGSHCHFCPAGPTCPELRAKAQAAAVLVFPELPLDDGNLKAPDELTDDEIGQSLTCAEYLSAWLSHVRREAQGRVSAGRDVAGWKLVARKGYRKWTDPDQLGPLMLTLGHPADTLYSRPEPVTPAEAERRVKGLGLKPSVLAPLIKTPEAGLTLVPADDPRPAVDIAPGTVFPDDPEGDPDA